MYIIASSFVAMFANSYRLTMTESVSFPIYFAMSDSFINPRALSIMTAGMSLNLLKLTSIRPSLFSEIRTGIL